VSLSEKTLPELLEQAKKLVKENKSTKDEHIMLEQQVKGKYTILQCTLHVGLPQLIISFSYIFPAMPRRKQKALNRHKESRAGGIRNNRRKYKAERSDYR